MKMAVLLAAIIIGAVLEMLALSLVSPFISTLLDNTYVETSAVTGFFYRLLGMESPQEMLILLAFLLAGLYIGKSVYAYLVFYIQYRFLSFGRIELSERLISRMISRPFLYHAGTNVAQMQKILVNDVDSLFGVVVAILMFLTDAFMILFIML
ncbi:MAG: hypothetical protein LBH39_08690, partial [Clostridiales Family XIII bacterium]|nr:hypothetical protein [Clostridiales Family XIII bacterium]